MTHPFVVCHMLLSLDGKIDGRFFDAPETAPALAAYANLRGHYRCPATLYGTTTMKGGYADALAPALSDGGSTPPPTDWISPAGRGMDHFIVSLDPKGELGFSSHVIAKKSRPPAHVIQVLTERVSPAYLSYLRERDVSYLFAGRERVACAQLLQKLQAAFGIDRLMVAGGGVTNQSFLREGLIDELSLVIAPVADGSGGAALFDGAGFLPPGRPTAFTLVQAEPLAGSTLWLRYRKGAGAE